MPVQQHVLNWLYSVLTSEYHDVNRTYNDVAQALARYPSLAPRTDVHTFPNGSSALLLHLSGTLPVNFRGNTYRFPLSIWVPHAYPREPPLVYVTPTGSMMIRPGQHIDPQGRVYHPYLVGWAEYWDKSTIRDFLALLSDVFAKEPPVIARQPSQAQSPRPTQAAPPAPPLPNQASTGSPNYAQHPPPPHPPKTVSHEAQGRSEQSTAGPPLPPLPPQSPASSRASSRYQSAPPLPTEAPGRTESSPYRSDQGHYESSPHQRPPQFGYTSPPPPAGPVPQYPGSPGQGAPPHFQQPPGPQPAGQGQWQQHPGYQQPPSQMTGAWNGAPRPAQQQPTPAPPPPDILDEPLTLDLPDRTSVAAPPIPPNPEKDAMLRQLAQTLASMRQQSRQQNDSSMAGLQAQRNAMLSVVPTLQSEMGQLAQMSSVLTSNTAILHEALHKADGVIEGSRRHPAPDIDELLVAPTVVANQLYTLVAEERALGDAIFMLGRAVERGRISPAVFAKMTRSLAREWYLKKALVRKIGLGMGLSV